MLSQFGQKKKKEAVRRLSQNAAHRQSLEGKTSKRTTIFSQKPKSLSGEKEHSGLNLRMKSVQHGQSAQVESKTETFGMTSGIPSVFGNVYASSSVSPASQEISGFPVMPAFPSTSHTGFGFPVSSTFTASAMTTHSSSVGFPVSTVKFAGFSSFSNKDKSSEVGFPVTPVKFGKDFEENKAKTSTGFQVQSVDTLGVKSDDKKLASEIEHKRFPLQQTQSFTSLSNMKTFGSAKTINEEKITVPDISKLKSLVIREIPPDCNKNTWLRRFYSRFGEIVKVLCNPNKNSATITFRTHEAARLAKVKGRILRKGCQPVSIFWKQERKRTISGSKDKQESPEKTEPVKQNIEEKAVVKAAVLSFDALQSLPLAISSGDKYKVLEMIDSKFREGVTKASDITTAKAVKGICPDMCPEKERYMREDRRRLHTFETVPGTGSMEENPLIDHTRAVKEYDRSAADKEEPLPHELRPVKTLQMTMDYLVTNIMDVGEGRWADWFDFLWNRTRAIRKDITQQHLCDPYAVDLIEKTARFHIFCSHYLCDQDFGVFDPKINTENLTKCLQTLKHFYDDLYKNQNITCPCEAEFRAYDILLNLNEGDILRQVMTYREEVRLSPLVQFAMEIFHALNSNNSVRFFRLVRSSTYLCSCLLHRYFTQVRQQAIRILNYSLSVPNKEMPYPLSELAQMLGFEDDSEAAMFCRFHGMTVNEPNVVFMRGSFVEPEAAFPLAKSLRLIESKRTSLIGEIVYNGPLPPNPNHIPTSSFNSNGQYIGDTHIVPTSPEVKVLSPKGFPKETHAEEGNFGESKSTFQGFSQIQSYKSTEPPKPPVQINVEELREVTKTLFLEVINEMLVDITNDVFGKVQQLLSLSNDIAKEIEDHSISVLIQEIAESAILHEQQQQIMEAEEEAHREKAASALASDIVNEVVEEESYNSATFVYNIEHQKLVRHCEEIATQQISQHILEQTVLEEIQKTVQESCRELKSQRKSALKHISDSFMVTRKERYFKRWIKSYRSLVKLKRLLSNFPSHCSLASPTQQLSQLIGPQFDAGTCTFHTTRIFRDEQNIAETLSSRRTVMERIRSVVLRSIDIPQLIAGVSGSRLTKTTINSCMDWKLLLSFRNPCQDLDLSVFNESKAHVNASVIREKFSKGTTTDTIDDSLSEKLELLSLYSAEVPSSLSTRKRCRICTLASYGIPSNNDMISLTSSRHLQGTSALLIVAESNELHSYSHRQELLMRVQRLLQSKPDIPAIPVVILFLKSHLHQDDVTEEAIIDAVGIDHHSSHVSEVTVIMLPSITEIQTLDDVLNEAVTWLLQRSNIQLELESNSLKNFVEEGIQRYFCTSFYDDVATRKKAGLADQCPEALIALYNAVIEHLAAVASSSKLGRVSWPIKEFCKPESNDTPHMDWNSEPSLSSLRSVILSLLLPPPPPRAENGLWDSEAPLCQLYIQQIPQNSTYLAQRINRLLQHKRLSLNESNLSAEEVPWTQVIEACISSLLTSLYSDPVLSRTEVYFFVNEIDAFEQPEIWRQAALSSKEESLVELEKTRIQQSPSMKSKDALIHESVQMIDENLDTILKNSKMRLVNKNKQTTSLENSIVDLKGKLGTALLEARDDIISFEKDIQRWLPDCYTESTKKRKAEATLHCQIPILKSSRQSTDIPH